MIIGLTGSIAMGKSKVAKIFRDEGIPVFDSDAEVHKLYNSKEGADLIRPFVPAATEHNKVDRKIITELVLRDPNLLVKLEKNVHDEIARRRKQFISKQKSLGHTHLLIDTPLLFETGAEKEMDYVIVVSSTAENQESRALARPNMTPERLNMIRTKQMHDAEKRKRATYVIDNNGSLEELRIKTKTLINGLKNLA
jgi:dephospho-CoA kinase